MSESVSVYFRISKVRFFVILQNPPQFNASEKKKKKKNLLRHSVYYMDFVNILFAQQVALFLLQLMTLSP